MKRRIKKRSEKEKEEILNYLHQFGRGATVQKYGVSASTLYDWENPLKGKKRTVKTPLLTQPYSIAIPATPIQSYCIVCSPDMLSSVIAGLNHG